MPLDYWDITVPEFFRTKGRRGNGVSVGIPYPVTHGRDTQEGVIIGGTAPPPMPASPYTSAHALTAAQGGRGGIGPYPVGPIGGGAVPGPALPMNMTGALTQMPMGGGSGVPVPASALGGAGTSPSLAQAPAGATATAAAAAAAAATTDPGVTTDPAKSPFDVAFDEGFNAGWNTAQGIPNVGQSAIPVHDDAYNQAWSMGFETGLTAGSTGGGNAEIPTTPGTQGINAIQASKLLQTNPEVSIGMGTGTEPGMPGFNTIQSLGVNPLALILAAGGSTTNPVSNLQQSNAMFNQMGTAGGNMVDAAKLLQGMAHATIDTEVGQLIADRPSTFREFGANALTAAGASEFAINAFHGQMDRMYYEYHNNYLLTQSADAATLPFNAWLVQNHPEVVASWSS